MAFVSTITEAALRLNSLISIKEKITFSDLESTPTSTINWTSAFTTGDLDLKTAVTPSASNPVEVAVSAPWGDLITASGTSHTLDLTALTRSTELGDLDMTGLKLQGFLLSVPYTNTDPVIVVPGATNGYNIQNDGSTSIGVAPGGVELCFYPENTSNSTGMPAVSPTVKTIDFSSAMTNFQILVILFAG